MELANSMASPLATLYAPRIAAIHRCISHLLGPDEPGSPGVTRSAGFFSMAGLRQFDLNFCWSEFCSWQAGRDRLNSPLPDVLAGAGTSVLAFQKPETIGDHSSFRDIRKVARKGRKELIAFGRMRAGGFPGQAGSPRSCPRLQALCEETQVSSKA